MPIVKNEPLAANRRIGPMGVYTPAGVEAPDNLTFVGAGEAEFSQSGVYVAAAGTVVSMGAAGQYYYEATQAETNFNGTFVSIKLNKAGYRIVTGVEEMVPAYVTTTSVVNAILDELLSAHAVVGSVADGIAIAAGLLQGNFFMDQTNNSDPNGQTVARLRVFRTGIATSAATDGGIGEGEFATFLVTTTYVGPNKIKTHRVVRQ
jgi:hypothetical protein